MLTADLVRAQVRKDQVYPRYLDLEKEGLEDETERLIEIFRQGRGRTVGDLEEAIADHIGDANLFLVTRGLAKLLWDRTEVATSSPADPQEVRRAVFGASARTWPVVPGTLEGATGRAEVLTLAAEELGLTPEQVEEALYADLKVAQTLVDFREIAAGELLRNYNLSLAQAVLLRARRVRVELPNPTSARIRTLLRIAKFHRLMFEAERVGTGKKQRLVLTLDGPLSLFRHTNRYGLQLANFLPSLMHCERWSLEAQVAWGPERREVTFEVDHKQKLETTRGDRGAWVSEEEKHFRATWKKQKTPWKIRQANRVISLGGHGFLVPDYELVHPDGRRALLELVWSWRRRTFEDRLDVLREHGPSNLVVAVAARMRTDDEGPADLPGAVYPFKGVIQPKKILELAEQVGCV